eukprot:8180080-Pyramimonas_sp.AAC.1
MDRRLAKRVIRIARCHLNQCSWTQHTTAGGFFQANTQGNGFQERYICLYANKDPLPFNDLIKNLEECADDTITTIEEVLCTIRRGVKGLRQKRFEELRAAGAKCDDPLVIILLDLLTLGNFEDLWNRVETQMELFGPMGEEHMYAQCSKSRSKFLRLLLSVYLMVNGVRAAQARRDAHGPMPDGPPAEDADEQTKAKYLAWNEDPNFPQETDFEMFTMAMEMQRW